MRHPALGKWEERLKALLDEVDDVLETKYGSIYPLHPARKKRGQTANKEQDGLFDIGSSFSPGFGSDIGRGYIVTIDMVTLAHIQSEIREKIERAAVRLIREKLRDYFPERELRVGRDGDVIKIYGDLSLGEA
jgi:hypothetical protein